jgi:hypothetical protein
MEIFVKLLFAAVFILVFIVGSLKLHPFRKHHIWNISTFYLKFSYLTYLAFILTYSYLSIFYRDAFTYNPNWVNDIGLSMFHIFVLVLYMLPTGIILIRKQIHNRRPYNIIFGSINIFFTFCLISLIVRFYSLYLVN